MQRPITRYTLKLILLSCLAVLCAGCKSCVGDGPEIFPRSDLEDRAPAAPEEVVPEPSVPAPSAVLDPRAVNAVRSLEELNDRAYAEGLLVEVYFDFDRADLSAEARAALEHNARYLRQSAGVRLTIEGHCDERGTHEYNLALGQLRASAARQFLVRLGIEADRLGTISYGEHEGVCFVSNEACWARNRRAFFRITAAPSVTDPPPSGNRPRAGS